jgi:uncharacterized integral membrane protein
MRRLGRFTWLVITMLLGTVAITFATSNETLLELYLWPFDGGLTAPVWLVVISSFIVGGLFSVFLMSAQALAIRARLWNLQGKFNRLEAEMAQHQSPGRTLSDKQANEVRTAHYAPAPSMKDQ